MPAPRENHDISFHGSASQLSSGHGSAVRGSDHADTLPEVKYRVTKQGSSSI